MKISYILLIASLFITTQGCIKGYQDMIDTEDIKLTNLNGTYAIPAVNAQLTLFDLLNSSNPQKTIQTNNSGFLSIIYDTLLMSQAASEYIKISNISSNISYPIDGSSFDAISLGQSLNVLTNEAITQNLTIGTYEIDLIKYEQGALSITPPTLPHDAIYTFSFPYLKNSNNNPITFTKNVTANSQELISIDLSSHTMDHRAGDASGFNKFQMILSANITKRSSTPLPTSLNFQFNISNIKYQEIEGYFGSQSFASIPIKIPIDAFEHNNTNGYLEVENPILDLKIYNSLQAPIELSLTNQAINVTAPSNPILVTGNPFPVFINGAQSASNSSETELKLAPSLSPNIGTIIRSNPVEIAMEINSKLNPVGKSNTRNKIKNSDRIQVYAKFELPLSIKATNFILTKKIEFKVSDIPNRDSTIDYVTLKVNSLNYFPLDVILQLDFIDPNSGLSILKILNGSNNFLNGYIDGSPGKASPEIVISGRDWTDMAAKGVKEIKLTGYINTVAGSQSFQIIRPEMKIETQIGARLKLKGL